MNSTEVLTLVNKLASLGAAEKRALVEQHLVDTTFSKVLNYAVDPFITYGVSSVCYRGLIDTGIYEFGPSTWLVLDMLKNRRAVDRVADALICEEVGSLNEASQELFFRIIDKDLLCGVTGEYRGVIGRKVDFVYSGNSGE